jgi:hypothetical protein
MDDQSVDSKPSSLEAAIAAAAQVNAGVAAANPDADVPAGTATATVPATVPDPASNTDPQLSEAAKQQMEEISKEEEAERNAIM